MTTTDSDTKRTVFVLNHFSMPLSHAGGTRHVELFSGLERWNTRIFSASRTNAGQKLSSSGIFTVIPVTAYRGNGIDRVLNWASYTVGACLRTLFTRKAPSVFYGSSPHMGAALAAMVVAKIRRRPFVLEIRDIWPQILAESGTLSAESRAYRFLRRIEVMLYQSCDRVVVLAEGTATHIEADGVEASKIHFIPNCGDPEDFVPSADRASLRAKLGFDQFTIVYTGAHGPANGLDLVLDAAEEIAHSDPGIRFVLYGNGVHKAQLKASASERGLTNIEFRDPVPKSEIPDILAAADVGLHSLADVELFRTGVSPNKLYDYMAAGLPVITNNLGDMAAMTNRAKSGLAVAPDGIAAGARQLAHASPSELADFGAAGAAFMQAERSRSAMTRRLEALLDELVP